MSITNKEMKGLLKLAEYDERWGVAFRGALSQVRIKNFLLSKGLEVHENQSDNIGKPDFVVDGKLMEHKRAKNKKTKKGNIQAEFQKSRGKTPDRLYDINFSDIVSVDISAHTGIKDDYRFNFAHNLKTHRDYPDKIKPIQTIDNSWQKDISLLF